ncbi:MAG: acetate kinase [Acidobacteria bacterium RIFCSPHIGHO2_02_FULL_67_57]|nr:MAG: acetate kinase [Acidobacteria bacterium RIFCSPHIGHO2_02_FULL_67_57]OFV85257.1 MAG: acetate kinase [Acidobacteria bacterium RIFCSPHIGHO2_01_FULL_67_28]
MKILVLNCGSSSVKFQYIETDLERIDRNQDRRLASGLVEKIGTPEAAASCQAGERTTRDVGLEIADHHAAIAKVVAMLQQTGALADPKEIHALGHRVVHGGDFQSSQLITAEVLKKIEEAVELAPLHNPHNLKGYTVCRELFPDRPHVAVFDTAFHQTMPARAYLYALPYDHFRRHRIRRYGFHGTSHRYVAYRFRQLAERSKEETNLITCHLGNGCSITAIQFGRSVDTSMGFTPLEGLVMGTRPGDFDPAIVLHLMAKLEMTPQEVSAMLNRHSGLYGLSGESNDMRQILESARQGHERARRAVDVFCYRLRKYIGAYTAVLGQVHGLVFTGGIGENAPRVRDLACEGLNWLGYELDRAKNEKAVGVEADISGRDSRVQIFVIPTNEELLIARDTYRVIEGVGDH